MNLWQIHLGWFVLGAFAVLALVMIGMEWWCWREQKALFITKDKNKTDEEE